MIENNCNCLHTQQWMLEERSESNMIENFNNNYIPHIHINYIAMIKNKLTNEKQ
jgi:hypothetical protein